MKGEEIDPLPSPIGGGRICLLEDVLIKKRLNSCFTTYPLIIRLSQLT